MLMKKLICLAVLSLCILTGCSERGSEGKENMENEAPFQEPAEEPLETLAGNLPENSGKQPVSEPNIVLADWSEYFDGINGAAVLTRLTKSIGSTIRSWRRPEDPHALPLRLFLL